MSQIQRAILSVTDKSGLVDFARKLVAFGVELVSTGGTAKLLRDSGIPVKDISELTGFPEMLDGRVKTLHPKVHGGILHRREDSAHLAAVAEHGIPAIALVAFVPSATHCGAIIEEMAYSGCTLSRETKWRLAQKAFAMTAAYDSAIA